jgi:hypothetical protein
VSALFIPDQNPNTPVRGVYIPAPKTGDDAHFKPFNHEDIGKVIPQDPSKGIIKPEKGGYDSPHGTFTPSLVEGEFGVFRPVRRL